MVRRFVRNYGMMMAGAFGILCGMLVYQHYKQDVLEYSLGMVGTKLAGMAETEDKSSIMALYEAFKDRALANEVSTGDVEHVAANILNLQQEGSHVTSEQVKAMLDEPKMVLTSFGVPSPIQSFEPVAPGRPKELGETLKSLCEFDDQFQQALQKLPQTDHECRKKVHYDGRNGLRVMVDVDLKRYFPKKEFDRVDRDLRALQKDTMVVWRDNLQDSLNVVRTRMREHIAGLSDSSWNPAAGVEESMKGLKSLSQLANFDFHFDEARLKTMLDQRMKRMEEKIKRNRDEKRNRTDVR